MLWLRNLFVFLVNLGGARHKFRSEMVLFCILGWNGHEKEDDDSVGELAV